MNEFLTEYLEFDNVDGFTNPYIASGWYYIKMDIGSNGIKDYETPVEGMLPYWSSNNNNCYSYDKCLVFDTTKNDEFGNNDVSGPYDWRQSIYTMIDNSSLSYKQKRKNQEYKVSFMMKTKPFNESTLLKDTGIHLIGSYMDSQDNHLSTDGEAAVNYRYEKLGSQNDTEMSHRKNTALQKNTNSQCSRNTHYDSHFADSNAKACYNCGVDVDTYCDEIRASFTNTKIDTWEKMEVTFRPDFVDYYLNFDGKDLKLMFSPLQIAVETPYDFLAGGLRRFTPGFVPEYNNFIYVDDADYFDNPLELKQIFGTSQNNEVESGSFTPVDLNKSSARVYIDDIKFTESFDFHPDCDVRKKLTNTTSQYSLMEYNSADIDETKAPLKAQFYFYPRENSDDVFSEKRFPHQEEFKYGQYYICNIDWGDGSTQSSGASWVSPTTITHNYVSAVDTFIVTITEINSGCIIEGVVVIEEATSASIQIPIGGLTQACAPQELEFTNSSTNTSETTFFTWDFGDGNTLTLENTVLSELTEADFGLLVG